MLDDAQLVELRAQRALGGASQPLSHAYFPTDCLISQLSPLPDGRAIEVGMIGPEGMLGASCALGTPVCEFNALVQNDGYAWKIDTHLLAVHSRQSDALNCLLIGYLHVQIAQCGRQASCCWYHSLAQRLCRWLLMTQDRLQSGNFLITHEFLAAILGTRRAGVTKAAGALQRRELIAYRRGHLVILDRAGLLASVCSCYAQDLDMYQVTMNRMLAAPADNWPLSLMQQQ